MEKPRPWRRCVLLPHVQASSEGHLSQRVTDRGPERVLIDDVLKQRFFQIVVTSDNAEAKTILRLISWNGLVWSCRHLMLMLCLSWFVVAAFIAPEVVRHLLD